MNTIGKLSAPLATLILASAIAVDAVAQESGTEEAKCNADTITDTSPVEQVWNMRARLWTLQDRQLALHKRIEDVTTALDKEPVVKEVMQEEISALATAMGAVSRYHNEKESLFAMTNLVSRGDIGTYLPIWQRQASKLEAEWSESLRSSEVAVNSLEIILLIRDVRPFATGVD